jgi:hypothetical protein
MLFNERLRIPMGQYLWLYFANAGVDKPKAPFGIANQWLISPATAADRSDTLLGKGE